MNTGADHQTRELLDGDITRYTLADWRARNVRLYGILTDCGAVDPKVVPASVVAFLVDHLVNARVGAALDLQNAGHIRAQNENVVYYGMLSGVSREALTIALVAGLIHDLNKAYRERLREDRFAVTDDRGHVLREMTTDAQIVGLNHLGERTRRALSAATRRSSAPLEPGVADAIDLCIVHHGLGSSRFIRDLIEGVNPWWGHEFVDPRTEDRLLRHPAPPPLSVPSILHDLADSTQQMQAGLAWLMKYPIGYWSGSGRSFVEMLSGGPDDEGPIPLSLRRQIEVETETSRGIVRDGETRALLSKIEAARLLEALDGVMASSRRWVETPHPGRAAGTVYADVAHALGVSIDEVYAEMARVGPGDEGTGPLERAIWASARRLDSERAAALADLIHRQ